MDKLTEKEERFCQMLIEGAPHQRTVTEAYKLAYATKSKNGKSVNRQATIVHNRPRVLRRLAEIRGKIAEKADLKVADVLDLWRQIATADPNEIIQNRRGCCRFCHGKDHFYQWISPREFSEALAKAITAESKNPPVNEGGWGYNANREPNPGCPRCFGDGLNRVYLADTRRLKGAAKLLYGGLETTRDGIKIKLRDQDGALQNIARFLGMLNTKIELPPDDKGNRGTIPIEFKNIDAVTASLAYQKLISGK